MPVKVEKSSTAKGTKAKTPKDPPKTESVSSFSSPPSGVRPNTKKTSDSTTRSLKNTAGANNSNNNNNNSNNNSNNNNNDNNSNNVSAGPLASRQMKYNYLARKRADLLKALHTGREGGGRSAGKRRGSGGLLEPFSLEPAPKGERTPSKSSPISEPSLAHRFPSVEETSPCVTTVMTPPMAKNSNNDAIELLNHQEVCQREKKNKEEEDEWKKSEEMRQAALSLCKTNVSTPYNNNKKNNINGQVTNLQIPSECSSMNSSIADTPYAKEQRDEEGNVLEEGQGEEREELEKTEDENRTDLFSHNGVNDMYDYTPYDEEDEEEAVQQYMRNRDANSAGWESDRNEKCAQDSAMAELKSKVAIDTETLSVERGRSAERMQSRPRRLWRKHQHDSATPTTPVSTAGATASSPTSATTTATASRRRSTTPLSLTPRKTIRSATSHTRLSGRACQEVLTESLCRSLSLYSAFFLDAAKKKWLVDDLVLARCLDYVGLMGYQQIMFDRNPSSQEDILPRMVMGQLSSPITHVHSDRKRSSLGMPSTHWGLSGPPCSKWVNSSIASTLFLHQLESERWLSEQEYVIGTILSCCAWMDGYGPYDVSQDEVEPYLPTHCHPIRQAATFLLERYPHWGGVADFVDTWERQVCLVLGTASPSHQRVFPFREEGVVFSSDMEGGNLARVERTKSPTSPAGYTLWLEPEFGCAQRLWFRFSICGARAHNAISLKIVNVQPNTKLYAKNGMRPVWRAGNSTNMWTPVEMCVYRVINNDEDGELAFVIIPRTDEVVHVAFCVPYTYADLLCHISHWHYLVKKSFGGIRFEERVLCHTQDGRKLHLLIITGSAVKSLSRSRSKNMGGNSNSNILQHRHYINVEKEGENGTCRQTAILGPYSHFETGKKVVLLSGRVHPGEVTASHALHGVITFLLSHDPHAKLIREHFIFFIVPMLNPDGVSRGHSRLDQNGFNLNRCYKNPIPQTQPTVNALRKVFDHLQHTYNDRFFMYMDFHSHASQSSGFMFGNCLPVTVQHWNMLFPKIVSLHAKDVFSYQLCRFGRGHMISKEGSSRVLFGETLIHSYTVELRYFSDYKMYVDGTCEDEKGDNNNINSNGGRGALANGVQGDVDLWDTRYTNTHVKQTSNTTTSTTAMNGKSRAPSSSPQQPSSLRSSSRTRTRTRSRSARAERQQNNPQQHVGTCGGQRQRSIDKSNASSAAKPDPLCCIETPCILSQSARVGRACVLALLDYCGVQNYTSPQFAACGGMEHTLREVKRNANAPANPKPQPSRLQMIYKPH